LTFGNVVVFGEIGGLIIAIDFLLFTLPFLVLVILGDLVLFAVFDVSVAVVGRILRIRSVRRVGGIV
jgi:hypothetical protein